MRNLIKKLMSFLVIFAGSILILSLYLQTAEKLGIIQNFHHQSTDALTLIFSMVLSIPAMIVCFWPVVVRQEILLPRVLIGNRFWRVRVTRWRVAFIAALCGLLLLELFV